MEYYRFLVKSNLDATDTQALSSLKRQGLAVQSVYRYDIYCVLGNISTQELHALKSSLFCTELIETCTIMEDSHATYPCDNGITLEVMFLPGVTDTRSREAMVAMQEMQFYGVKEIVSGTGYHIQGAFTKEDKQKIATTLCNSSIQYYCFGAASPRWVSVETDNFVYDVEKYDFAKMNDEELLQFSAEKKASLDLGEMQKIKEYFIKVGRPCTDAEFETIAQTWSEHCVHKTFKANITIESSDEQVKEHYPDLCVNNVLKTYIKKATDDINADWVVSAFVDNAGIVRLDENFDVSFKVETHNHPSAIEPFGGANTGVGGVIRDVMGVSARPFALTDVLCFGPPDISNTLVPPGSLHPQATLLGVVDGVSDYGNKMGIPNVNGGIHFGEGYTTNPLVYCGCVGIAKHNIHKTQAQTGDHIFALGAPTGRDAIRGATFSSMAVDAGTGTVAGAAVQIGDPIIQKKVSEVLDIIVEEGLYSAITDCGAGGFSSAVGEMSSKLGCRVDLTNMPVKYVGLQAWERWISESQERMVLAVPEHSCARVKELCSIYDVIAYDLGVFTGDGMLQVLCNGEQVINLDCSFLHSGPPQKSLRAIPYTQKRKYTQYHSVSLKTALLQLLSDNSICSRESIVRRYDYEVQGGTVLRQYDGVTYTGPQDASVVQPREITSHVAVAISNALLPRYSAFGAYEMTSATIDEAVRSIVAVGGDPLRIGILDNYCMGDPSRPDVMWDLIESARACYNTACFFKTPFISGKDSFYNEYISVGGSRKAIPASLLISAIGIVPNIDNVVSSDLKCQDTALFLYGRHDFQLAGSIFAENFGLPSDCELRISTVSMCNAQNYCNLHKAISKNLVLSCHDISDGGMLVALAEMCIGSGIGAQLELETVLNKNTNTNGECTTEELAFLFGETTGCFILEVKKDTIDEVKQILGQDLLLIGNTSVKPELNVHFKTQNVFVSLDELTSAFCKPLL